MITSISQRMHARSTTMLASLETRLDRILIGWLLVAGLVSALRIALAPVRGQFEVGLVLPYLLIVIAPLATTVLALRWFRNGDAMAQPDVRLAIVGKWRNVSPVEARNHRLYGTSGIMVSMLIGMMINVPLRAAEYFAVMPPIPSSAPQWLLALRFAMTLDTVLFSCLYMVAFVAALRRMPLFPRLLGAIWLADVAMQLGIAQMVVHEAIPSNVATALSGLLTGNAQKVLISITLWMPYLLLSKRVNVTYRQRVPAA